MMYVQGVYIYTTVGEGASILVPMCIHPIHLNPSSDDVYSFMYAPFTTANKMYLS